jgi:hypothetical protein
MTRSPPSPRAPRAWGAFATLCVLVVGFGVVCLLLGTAAITWPESVGPRLLGITDFATHYSFLFYAAGVTIVPFGLGLVLPKTPGVWVYDLVLICAVMVSVVALPIAWPVLSGWLQPETKRYFGRTPRSPNLLDEPPPVGE